MWPATLTNWLRRREKGGDLSTRPTAIVKPPTAVTASQKENSEDSEGDTQGIKEVATGWVVEDSWICYCFYLYCLIFLSVTSFECVCCVCFDSFPSSTGVPSNEGCGPNWSCCAGVNLDRETEGQKYQETGKETTKPAKLAVLHKHVHTVLCLLMIKNE